MNLILLKTKIIIAVIFGTGIFVLGRMSVKAPPIPQQKEKIMTQVVTKYIEKKQDVQKKENVVTKIIWRKNGDVEKEIAKNMDYHKVVL